MDSNDANEFFTRRAHRRKATSEIEPEVGHHKRQKTTLEINSEVVDSQEGLDQPQTGASTTLRAASTSQASQSIRASHSKDRLMLVPNPDQGRYEPLPAGEHAKSIPTSHIGQVGEHQTAQPSSDNIMFNPSDSQAVPQNGPPGIPRDDRSRPGLNFTLDHSKIINHGLGEVHVGSHNSITSITNNINESRRESHEDILRRIERLLGPYLVHNAVLSNFHQPCHSGTRRELLHRLATWIAGPSYSFAAEELSAKDPPAAYDHFFGEGFRYRYLLPSSATTTHFAEVFGRLQNCICIVGDPGSGKSTLITSVVAELLDKKHEHCPTLLSADYCIRRTHEFTTDPDKVLPTLIYRLATTNPQLAQVVDSALTLHSRGIGVPKNQANILLKAILQHRGTVLLVIDALDELSRPASLATTLSNLIPQLPANVRLILSSRNEHDVLHNIGAELVQSIRLDIPTDESFWEVRNYIEGTLRQGLRAQFGENPYWNSWPTTTQLDALADLAAGLYVWAATACKHILNLIRLTGTANRDAVLERAAQKGGLDGLYTRILDDALGDGSFVDPDRLSYINKILGFIVVAEHALTLSDTAAILDISQENFDVIRFAELAQTVLVAGTKHIQVEPSTKPRPHRTFIDFLTRPGAGNYRVFPSQQHQDILCGTLRYLVTHLHFNMFGLESSFLTNYQVPDFQQRVRALPPGLKYAGLYWAYHLKKCDADSPLPMELLHRLLADRFLFWLEVTSGVNNVMDAQRAIEVLVSRLQVQKTPTAGVITEESDPIPSLLGH